MSGKRLEALINFAPLDEQFHVLDVQAIGLEMLTGIRKVYGSARSGGVGHSQNVWPKSATSLGTKICHFSLAISQCKRGLCFDSKHTILFLANVNVASISTQTGTFTMRSSRGVGWIHD